MTNFVHTIPEWLELISMAFLVGALICRLWVIAPPETAKGPNPPAAQAADGLPYKEEVLSGMWRLFCICIAVMIISSIANLLMRASEMSGKPFEDVCLVLPTVIFRTHLGRVFLVRFAALILLSIALKAGSSYRDSRRFLLFALGVVAVVSMTGSASGHASDAGDLSLREIMDWIHLVATSVWGGGLFVLSVIILPKLIGPEDPEPPLIAGVASRFSRIAGFSVAAVLITALYNAWVYVGSTTALLKTPYGMTVLIKIVLFFVLLNLGAFNRYVNVPLLQKWGGISSNMGGVAGRFARKILTPFLSGQEGRKTALRFKRSVRFEAMLVLGVLLCAALLRHEIPARHASHLGHTGGKMQHMLHDHEGNPQPDRDNRGEN